MYRVTTVAEYTTNVALDVPPNNITVDTDGTYTVHFSGGTNKPLYLLAGHVYPYQAVKVVFSAGKVFALYGTG